MGIDPFPCENQNLCLKLQFYAFWLLLSNISNAPFTIKHSSKQHKMYFN